MSPAKPGRVSAPLGSPYPFCPNRPFFTLGLRDRDKAAAPLPAKEELPPKKIEGEPQPQGLSSHQHSPQTPEFYSQLDFNAQPPLSSVGKATPAKEGKALLPLVAPGSRPGLLGRGCRFYSPSSLRPPPPPNLGAPPLLSCQLSITPPPPHLCFFLSQQKSGEPLGNHPIHPHICLS